MIDRIRTLLTSCREVIAYLIVGGLTTIVSLGIYYGLVLTILDPHHPIQLQTANVCSWIGAVSFAYFTNRRFVFHSSNPDKLREASRFFAARIGTLLLDMAIMFFTVTLGGFNDKIAKLAAQVAVTIANYLFSKLLVFRHSPDHLQHTEDADDDEPCKTHS